MAKKFKSVAKNVKKYVHLQKICILCQPGQESFTIIHLKTLK